LSHLRKYASQSVTHQKKQKAQDKVGLTHIHDEAKTQQNASVWWTSTIELFRSPFPDCETAAECHAGVVTGKRLKTHLFDCSIP